MIYGLDKETLNESINKLKEGKGMTQKKLEKIRNFIIDSVIREPAYMFSEKIRGTTDDDIDLVEIIASLYEELHYEVTGEHYDYMFHWANKCGSWVESDLFEKEEFDV